MKEWIDSRKEWLYKEKVGKFFLNLIIKRKFMSKIVGAFADSSLSRFIIPRFASEYGIDINPETTKFVIPHDGFKNLNGLFTRDYKREFLNFPFKDELFTPAEGYLSVQTDIKPYSIIQAKGIRYFLRDLIGEEVSPEFYGGVLLRIRLTPKEYHHFHYLDNSIIRSFKQIKGNYYTAEDLSVKNIPDVFCKGYRHVMKLDTKNFGNVYYVEIGSTFVGSIHQNNKIGDFVNKGDKKGHFKFGGSTAILVFEKDKIKLDKRILNATENNKEYYIGIGKRIGRKFKL